MAVSESVTFRLLALLPGAVGDPVQRRHAGRGIRGAHDAPAGARPDENVDQWDLHDGRRRVGSRPRTINEYFQSSDRC